EAIKLFPDAEAPAMAIIIQDGVDEFDIAIPKKALF
ncbi:hypothetical protein AAUPMC_10129, partial [Pasteurella multocida subsp. multocida str. Anand1_cattle]